jgi:hypothetical protein
VRDESTSRGRVAARTSRCVETTSAPVSSGTVAAAAVPERVCGDDVAERIVEAVRSGAGTVVPDASLKPLTV